jgi:excinuclease ABC subunit C
MGLGSLYPCTMLELDCGLAFDPAHEEEFFAAVPPSAGILLVEPRVAGAQPHLVRTADLRRAAERLLRPPEPLSKRLNLREVAAAIRYRVTGSKFEQLFALYDQAKLRLPHRYRDLLRLRRPALLKVNLRNEYPRCYVTRRLRGDGGFYFGPFASRHAADAFSEGFLDLFKIRRCQIKIRRDPAYPGCIYSEMKMCLAPCFAGCTKEEYDAEVDRVLEALDTTGTALTLALERERAEASEALQFERAALLHKRLEKTNTALRGLPELVRRIENLDAVILQRAAEEKTIALFAVRSGLLDEPVFLRFGELSSQPQSIDAILRQTLQPPAAARESQRDSVPAPAGDVPPAAARETYGLHAAPPELTEHLSLVARWFYSKPREGEILFREKDWPYRRILRAIGRLLAPPAPEPPPTVAPPNS